MVQIPVSRKLSAGILCECVCGEENPRGLFEDAPSEVNLVWSIGATKGWSLEQYKTLIVTGRAFPVSMLIPTWGTVRYLCMWKPVFAVSAISFTISNRVLHCYNSLLMLIQVWLFMKSFISHPRRLAYLYRRLQHLLHLDCFRSCIFRQMECLFASFPVEPHHIHHYIMLSFSSCSHLVLCDILYIVHV